MWETVGQPSSQVTQTWLVPTCERANLALFWPRFPPLHIKVSQDDLGALLTPGRAPSHTSHLL